MKATIREILASIFNPNLRKNSKKSNINRKHI